MKRIFPFLFSALLVWLVFDIARFKVELDQPVERTAPNTVVDVIAVLTGGQRRLKEALTFLAQGRGKYLFISGIEPGTELEQIFKANRIDMPAEKFKGRIYLGEQSRSTFENAVEIRDILRRLDAKSLLLVTSTYHMHRAMELIRAELLRPPALDVELYSVTVQSPNFEQGTWWKSFAGWKILLSEYFKSKILFLNL